MSEDSLGLPFDIHGGGNDLIFPHHENEIAQSSCAHNGKPLSKYWLHNGFISMKKEKMSKSQGNIVLINDILKYLKLFGANVVKLLIIKYEYGSNLFKCAINQLLIN